MTDENKERYTSAEISLIVQTLNSHFKSVTEFVGNVTKAITQVSVNQMAQCKVLEELKTQYTLSEKTFLRSCELTDTALNPEKPESVTTIIRSLKFSLRLTFGVLGFLIALIGILMATGLIKITFIIPGGGS